MLKYCLRFTLSNLSLKFSNVFLFFGLSCPLIYSMGLFSFYRFNCSFILLNLKINMSIQRFEEINMGIQNPVPVTYLQLKAINYFQLSLKPLSQDV